MKLFSSVEKVKGETENCYTLDNFYETTLFHDVQIAEVFKDSKTFVDSIPNIALAEIHKRYDREKTQDNFDLKSFVSRYFSFPDADEDGKLVQTYSGLTMKEHIHQLWDKLTRQPLTVNSGSLLDLKHPYIVPGGRFTEIYYWDSYFTCEGLASAGKIGMVKNMIANFADFIDTYGYIPNGNRSYYLSRSQPPFFAFMLDILERYAPQDALSYLPQLEKEYAFWMAGSQGLSPGKASRRVVRLPGGETLNRYYSDSATPRYESYREDLADLAAYETSLTRKGHTLTKAQKAEFFIHLRAGAESGWDYSSRWYADPKDKTTLCTTHLIPVDLNCLLYYMERKLGTYMSERGFSGKAHYYHAIAERRARAIEKYCWNEQSGFYYDYNHVTQKQSPIMSLAAVYPLFTRMTTMDKARRVAKCLEEIFFYRDSQLLVGGGLVSTTTRTPFHHQWDTPNAWPPLQWMAIQGLQYYSLPLGDDIAKAWLRLMKKTYDARGKMFEKYNVVNPKLVASGGEYEIQDGFGWTNGVVVALQAQNNLQLTNRCTLL